MEKRDISTMLADFAEDVKINGLQATLAHFYYVVGIRLAAGSLTPTAARVACDRAKSAAGLNNYN